MTDKEINEAIAEACGWRKEDGVYMWTANGIDCTCPELWDYCSDLNAIHEAESTLPYNMHGAEFTELLLKIVSRDHDPACVFGRGSFAHVHASARQRAEAFLRALKKWEDK